MPTCKNITLSLRSSAHETVPMLEFLPPPHLPVPVEVNSASVAATYVLSSPGLSFWIAYHVKPPVPPDTKYFLFKLFMEGRHVVSWSVGAEENWKGKTMFGLFENHDWKGGVEKRAFAFSTDKEEGKVDRQSDHESRFLEVRVMRASARKRIQRETPELMETDVGREGAGGIDLVNAGCLKKQNPKRFYSFSLIDSLKAPYARFRYYYRTVEQLETLGVIVRTPPSNEDSEEEPVVDSGNGFDDLDLSFLKGNGAKGPMIDIERDATMGPESPQPVAQERLIMAVSPEYGEPEADVISPSTFGGDAAAFLRSDDFFAGSPHTSSPPSATLPKLTSTKSSPWSPSKGSRIAMGNSAVVPLVIPDSPTKGSVADPALVGSLAGQDWLKREPSPDRSIYREFDSPAPGASRRGRKSPTGRLKEALKRALRRGDA